MAYPEKQSDKQDAAEVKNYTRTPNMLIFGYRNISPQEKWLYTCLKHLCGKKGTRHLSLRYISEQTGISVGALSLSKDKAGKINEGMIRHLHNAGLIHSEIKKHDGKGNPQYHITITDVWGLNQDFFSSRSEFGQDEENASEVRTDNDITRPNSEQACPKDEQVRPNSEQACPNSSTILRLESKTTNKTTLQDCDGAAIAATPRTLSSEEKETTQGNEDATNSTHSGNHRGRDLRASARLASGAPPATLGDQDRATPAQQQRGASHVGRTEKPRTRKEPVAPAVTLSEQEQAFYDLYCSMPWIKLPPPITDKVKEQCARYARVFQTQEQLFSLKNWMQKQAYFKGKGFSLSLIGLAINDWAMEQEVQCTGKPAPLQRQLSEEERRAKEERKATALAILQANKQTSMAPAGMGGMR